MQSSSRFVYFTILQLFGNGVHLGAHITKRHSQMVRYIITLKRLTNYDIINLNYTLIYLRISFNYLHNVVLKRGIVLVANNHLELDAYFRNN